MRRRRDFHLQENPELALPPWYMRELFRLPGADGDDLCESFVALYRRDGRFRANVLAEVRACWWRIRSGQASPVGGALDAIDAAAHDAKLDDSGGRVGVRCGKAV
jgi:hypothetical protein